MTSIVRTITKSRMLNISLDHLENRVNFLEERLQVLDPGNSIESQNLESIICELENIVLSLSVATSATDQVKPSSGYSSVLPFLKDY